MPKINPKPTEAFSSLRKSNEDIFEVELTNQEQSPLEESTSSRLQTQKIQNPPLDQIPSLETPSNLSKSDSLLFVIDLMKNPSKETFNIVKKSIFFPKISQSNDNSFFRDEFGKTIVHHGAKNGESKALENIIKALKEEHLESLGLINGQEEKCYSDLFTAFDTNDKRYIRNAINKSSLNSSNKFGETALHIACNKGFEEIVELLLQKQSKVNATDSLLETPLHKASRENHIGTTLILLKNQNIKIDLQNSSKETALHIACKNNFENLAQSLIVNNADIALKDEENRSALHHACIVGSARIVKLLLDRGAKIDELGGKLNQSPLHIAVKNNHLDIAKLLLENGANIDELGPLDQTPLHIAVKNGNIDIAELLLDAGANIDAKNKLGFTPLHNAIRAEDVSMIKLLLERGSDNNIKDSSKETALDLVEKNLKSANPNSAFQEIKLILDEKNKIMASSTLRALSIDRLMNLHINDKSFGVD